MVLIKIVLVAGMIAAALAIAQRQHYFERVGFVGGCDQLAAPYGQGIEGAQWWSCREGVLTGYPSLLRDNCNLARRTSSRQVWMCPTPIERPSAL